jgi:hypothetical protein
MPKTTTSASDQWVKWGRYFETIKGILASLSIKREIHQAHREALSRNHVEDDGTGVVHRWMRENYAESMLMSLRRVIDSDHKTLSLVRLLEDIKSKAPEITFDKYAEFGRRAQAPPSDFQQEHLYARFSSDGSTLDDGMISDDIETLKNDNKGIRIYIDKVIAHREKTNRENPGSGPRPEAAWEDLDRLFYDIVALFNKYYSLVNPGVHLDFTSPILPSGFEQAFERMVIPISRP